MKIYLSTLLYICFVTRAKINAKNFRLAVKEKMQLQKETRKAKLLAERCLAKQENVMELKKTLCSAIEEREKASATAEIARQQ